MPLLNIIIVLIVVGLLLWLLQAFGVLGSLNSVRVSALTPAVASPAVSSIVPV